MLQDLAWLPQLRDLQGTQPLKQTPRYIVAASLQDGPRLAPMILVSALPNPFLQLRGSGPSMCSFRTWKTPARGRSKPPFVSLDAGGMCHGYGGCATMSPKKSDLDKAGKLALLGVRLSDNRPCLMESGGALVSSGLSVACQWCGLWFTVLIAAFQARD